MKKSFTELRRFYGLPETIKGKQGLRYRQPVEKGFAWYWFARYIRMRDFKRWGRCISCNKLARFEQLQAGHYGAAENCGIDLLMSEENCHGECGPCNGFDPGHLIGYERGLRERYGDEATDKLKADYLKARSGTVSKNAPLSPKEWGEKALHYKALFEAL